LSRSTIGCSRLYICFSGSQRAAPCIHARTHCRLEKAEAAAHSALKQGRKEVEGKLREVQKDQEVLSELNRGLISNQKVFKDKVVTLEAACKEKDETIAVRFLMKLCHAHACHPMCMQGPCETSCIERTQTFCGPADCLGDDVVTGQVYHAVVHGDDLCMSACACLQDLREHVRDLMLYLEASQLAAGNEDLAGGSAQVGEQKPKGRGRRR
jgi:hypothetical protein